MQLEPGPRASSIRGRLGAAACMLFATGTPALAQSPSGATTPGTQLDASMLLYGEANRVNIAEPTARITRLYANGQQLSAQMGIDVITGASPSGALPSGGIQTVTTPSGGTSTTSAGQVPVKSFHDLRGAFDGDWSKPWGPFTSTLSGHFSREKDYESRGGSGKLSVDLMHRLATLTVGAGFNRDGVFPVGGTPVGLTDGSVMLGTASNRKTVSSALIGVSRVLTRRWMVGVNAARTLERGYLTEPYKVISLTDPASGLPVSQLTENRPATRERTDILASSVYHFATDVLYLSYRYYWDDWKVRSSTGDIKYRTPLDERTWIEPHVRYYTQSAASFFQFSMVNGAPLPLYASSDMRLGQLATLTVGATLGFQLPDERGEWTLRGEYMRQSLGGQPPIPGGGGGGGEGDQGPTDLFPPVHIASLIIGYTLNF